GIATALSRESPEARGLDVLEGTLAYLSPEQTGRMNRALDYRTDLYSLGVTLYEMLTGARPFTGDPLELVHGHIARPPGPPHERAPEVPEAVSRVVLKLLAKAAEDRYQSAHGVRADLEECLGRLRDHGAIEGFTPALHDVAEKFRIPEKLYGRDAEVAAL